MGEEAVCLTTSSDGNTMDDKCFRAVKRSHECIVDNTETENPNKKPAIEPLVDENPGRAESNECALDSVEIEISNKNPKEESLNNENSFKAESRCLHECVVDAIAKVETRKNKVAQDDKNISRVESNCLNEHVVGAIEVETLNKSLAEEISNNEICSRPESNHSDECVVDVPKVENPNKKMGQEFSNDNSSCILESKCLSERAVDAMEVRTLNKKAAQEVSVDDNYSKIDSKGLDECFVDAMEVDTHNKKPEEDFSDDDNSSRLELNCSNECVVDGIKVDTPNKKSAVEISNNESSSRVEFKHLDKCDVDAHERDTPNKKLQQEVPTDEKSSRLEQKSLGECVLDSTEVDIPNKKLEENFSKVESKCSNECLVDTTEVESSNENFDEVIPNDGNYIGVESKCWNECIADAREAENSSKNLDEGISNDGNSSRVESKCLNECVLDAIEVEISDKNSDKVLLNNENSMKAELQCSSECFRDTVDVNKQPSTEISSDGNLSRLEPKYSNEFIVDAIEAETPIKHPVKESSTESSSEILNPNGSPHKNASSSQTVSSQHGEGLSKSGSWDITSSDPVESCAEVAGKEAHCMKGVSCSLSKKEAVVEGSKDANTCGVKRIIFKFSKSRDIKSGVYPPTSQPSCMEVDYGFSDSHLHEEPNTNPLKILGTSEDLLESTSVTKPYLYPSKKNNESKVFDGALENYTQNVKKLLSTGILEGVEVNYVNQEKKLLRGIIKDCGYLCGCALCNFSKVLNAYEFEQHAGCKTKHPNDHVILDNGKSIYSIIQELKNAPVSSLEDVIRALVGPLFNEKSYLKWKESLETGCFQRTERMGEKAEQSQQFHMNLVDFAQSTMRILLTRFLCDEVLDSPLIRRHLKQSDHRSYHLRPNSQPGAVKLPDNLESQLSKVSMQSDFLGRDSSGRLYWILGGPGACLQLAVDCSMPVQLERTRVKACSDSVAGTSYEPTIGLQGSWVFYESNAEIEGLMRCMRDSNSSEKDLKQRIMQWLRLINQHSKQDSNPIPDGPSVHLSKAFDTKKTATLITNAFCVLNKDYGPFAESSFTSILNNCSADPESTQTRRLYRCECLELIWPSKHHCLACHQTLSSVEEVQGHIERLLVCNPGPLPHNDSFGKDCSKCTGITSEGTNETIRDDMQVVEEISSNILANISNEELEREIELHDSNGISEPLPSKSPSTHDPSFDIENKKIDSAHSPFQSTNMEVHQSCSLHGNGLGATIAQINNIGSSHQCRQSGVYRDTFTMDRTMLRCSSNRDVVLPSYNTAPAIQIEDCCMKPESSFKPLAEKTLQIIRCLKINLLDMEAALPEEALKPSKAHLWSRSAWRTFVKSAGSIYEMIQALVVLENIITSEYLRSKWWCSVSLLSTVKTVSALALHIYSLDAAIMYTKSASSTSDPEEVDGAEQ